MDNEPSVEVVFFKLLPGVSSELFEQAARRTMPFIQSLAGFQSRELLYDAESEQWIDIVHWASLETALKAAATFGIAKEVAEFNQMIDPAYTKMLHLRPTVLLQ